MITKVLCFSVFFCGNRLSVYMTKLPAKTVYFVRTAVWEFNSGLIFTSRGALYFEVMKLSLVEVSANPQQPRPPKFISGA